jgi:hypothetical protein
VPGLPGLPEQVPGEVAAGPVADEVEAFEQEVDPQAAQGAAVEHGDNLAGLLDQGVLGRIAQEVLEGVEADENSCAELFEAFEVGIKLLGLKVERSDDPFDGASAAVYPLLLDAVVRFVATAHAELYPAAGPVRTQVYATGAGQDVEDKAQRKSRWMNFFLTQVDTGYYPDCDSGLLMLALYGSIFRKVYRDPVSGMPRSRFLTPFSLLVSYHAPDLQSAERVTQVEQLSHNEVIRRQVAGYYVDATLQDGDDELSAADRVTRLVEGRSPSGLQADAEHTHYHCHCWLDVPGMEHIGADGEPTGMRLPYIATVDKMSQVVLRLERDWEEGDPLLRRRTHYSHWLFHPGLGFYGWGLIALVGLPADTASVLLRQAINAFTLHSFPGGFRTKSARPEESNVSVGPCEFHEIDTGGLPIADAVMPMPYRDVPASFGPLLEAVVTAGQRLGQTMDMQVGEGRQDAPVGTTLALIEQAVRPTAAVLKRLHVAQAQEFQLLAALFARQPAAQYPYIVDGQRGVAMGADFADAADIVPVSDPNAPTHTQRVALAQAKLQLAQSSGGLIDMRAAVEGMLRVLGCDAAEVARLMPPPAQGQPSDVVTEFQFALKSVPLMAGPMQAHDAHLRAHIGQMMLPNLPPPVVQALMAHCADHLAWLYRLEASKAVGVPLQPGMPLPPEVEAQVAMLVANASQQIVAQIGPALGGAGGSDPVAMAKVRQDGRRLDFDIADAGRKAEETARQDATELLKVRAEAEQAAADREARMEEKRLDVQREVIRMAGAAARPAPQGVRLGMRAGGGMPPR